ncbi:unnamed protein product [marine sediment metagenome]|uniref:Uncharacterized protein n=1 Tax=marine sediment metagenome TaxID=412755 RepID=X0T019_9ZZZZ
MAKSKIWIKANQIFGRLNKGFYLFLALALVFTLFTTNEVELNSIVSTQIQKIPQTAVGSAIPVLSDSINTLSQADIQGNFWIRFLVWIPLFAFFGQGVWGVITKGRR